MHTIARIGLGAMLLLVTGCGAGPDGDAASRQDDQSQAIRASARVLINGLPAARSDDLASKDSAVLVVECSDGAELEASGNVLINGKAAPRFSQADSGCMARAATEFSANVRIGQ